MKLLTLRSSSMPYFMTCAPSELNPDKLQEVFTEIDAAELGTLVHEFAQRIVETGEYSIDELEARKPEDIARANLLIRNFYTIWNEAKSIITSPKTELFRSVKLVETDDLTITLTGHIDLTQIDPASAYILDYKTGRLHDNHYHQIAAYAYLVWDYAGRPKEYTVKVSVVYLEDNSISNYEFDADKLAKWAQEVVAKSNDMRYTISKKCAFCKIQGSCPAYREYTQAAIRFLTTEDAQKGKVGWIDVEPEERGSLVDAMYVVDKGIYRVKESLKSALSANKKDASIDLGNGMLYTKISREEKVLNTQKALPLLRRRFEQGLLDDITRYDLNDVLSLVASFAPPRGKGKAKAEFLEKLEAEGAIDIVKKDRHERRPAAEKKLGMEE